MSGAHSRSQRSLSSLPMFSSLPSWEDPLLPARCAALLVYGEIHYLRSDWGEDEEGRSKPESWNDGDPYEGESPRGLAFRVRFVEGRKSFSPFDFSLSTTRWWHMASSLSSILVDLDVDGSELKGMWWGLGAGNNLARGWSCRIKPRHVNVWRIFTSTEWPEFRRLMCVGWFGFSFHVLLSFSQSYRVVYVPDGGSEGKRFILDKRGLD